MGTDDPIINEEYFTYSDDAVSEAFEHYLEIRGEGHTGVEYTNRRYAFTAGINTGFHLAMQQRAQVERQAAPPAPDVSHETMWEFVYYVRLHEPPYAEVKFFKVESGAYEHSVQNVIEALYEDPAVMRVYRLIQCYAIGGFRGQ